MTPCSPHRRSVDGETPASRAASVSVSSFGVPCIAGASYTARRSSAYTGCDEDFVERRVRCLEPDERARVVDAATKRAPDPSRHRDRAAGDDREVARRAGEAAAGDGPRRAAFALARD